MQSVVTKRTSVVFKKGQTIFREGDIGEEMYIIKSGRIEVVKRVRDEEMILARLQAGSFFGEMALFGDKHRSATVRVIEDCEMIVIDKRILEAQFVRAPDWFVSIMRTLVQRLKETNKRLKSRYTISFEYSILKLVLWIAVKEGTQENGVLKSELSTVYRTVHSILGVSKTELLEKLRDFNFVHMVKYSEEQNSVTIPDEKKLTDFLLFLQAKADKKTRMTSDFEKLKSDPVLLQYFERIYRLLARKKGMENSD
ncbi:Crp/Fnr family transcriptional regulator [candidate division KSB1 bacterium]